MTLQFNPAKVKQLAKQELERSGTERAKAEALLYEWYPIYLAIKNPPDTNLPIQQSLIIQTVEFLDAIYNARTVREASRADEES